MSDELRKLEPPLVIANRLHFRAAVYTSEGRHDQWEAKALRQGMIAVNSILRDWARGQVVAVECGLFPAESAFFAHMLAGDGRPLIQHVADLKLLSAPGGA